MELQALLRSKNKCLERFLDITEKFLTKPTPLDDRLDELDLLQSQRDGILKAYQLFDNKVTECVQEKTNADFSPSEIESFKDHFKERSALITRIQEMDRTLIERLEQCMNDLGKDVQASRKGQSALSRFKSSWVQEAGEGIDQKL